MIAQDDMKDAWNNGKKLGPNPDKKKYTCQETGAHFEFNDMCHRIYRLQKVREMGVDHYIAVCLNIHGQMNAIFGEAQPGPNYRRGQHGSELMGNQGNQYAPTQFK